MMVHYCYQFWIIHLHFSFYWKIKCAKDKVEEKKEVPEKVVGVNLDFVLKLRGTIYRIQVFSSETTVAQN